MVLEARGLDTFPKQFNKFVKWQDLKSAAVIESNYKQEVGHVRAALSWLEYVCARDGTDPVAVFHEMVRTHYRGHLIAPFNDAARASAGMRPEYYIPLASGDVYWSEDAHSKSDASVRKAVLTMLLLRSISEGSVRVLSPALLLAVLYCLPARSLT